MPKEEVYFWWIVLSALSAFLLIIMITTVPQLSGRSNGLTLSPQVSQFVTSSYYVSSFIISMIWSLLGWFLLMIVDNRIHKYTTKNTEWSMAWIFFIVPILSFVTVVVSTIFHLTYLITVWGIPLLYIVSRTGYFFLRTIKAFCKKHS